MDPLPYTSESLKSASHVTLSGNAIPHQSDKIKQETLNSELLNFDIYLQGQFFFEIKQNFSYSFQLNVKCFLTCFLDA